MSNPLVSGPIETSSPFAGLLIIESGAALCSSIESGSWIEAKFVDNPGGRSMYEGTTDPRILDRLLAPFDNEINRYARVVADPSNPLTQLDVIVSTPAA